MNPIGSPARATPSAALTLPLVLAAVFVSIAVLPGCIIARTT